MRETHPVNHVELRRNANGHEIVVFSFPYRADIVDAVRSIPGRRFDWQAKEWSAPKVDATAAYVQGVIERFPELYVATDIETWLARAVKGWVGRVTAARRDREGLVRARRDRRRSARGLRRSPTTGRPPLAAVHRGGRRHAAGPAGARLDQRALRCATGCRSA